MRLRLVTGNIRGARVGDRRKLISGPDPGSDIFISANVGGMEMLHKTVRSPLLVSLLVSLLLAVVPAAAQQEDVTTSTGPDLSSPRRVFEVFLGAMSDDKRGSSGAIERAVACLDLSRVPVVVRDEAGPKLAADLKNYLDRVELIELDAIPRESERSRWVYRRTAAGEVSVTRADDGRWLFSPETLDSLPGLLDSVRGKKVVEGIEGGGGVRMTFADWLRARLPENALKRAFIIENWQWLALLVLAFAGVVIERIWRLFFGAWVRRLLARSEQLRDKKALVDFEKPIGIFVMALVWLVLLPGLDLPVKALAALKFAAQLVLAASGVWGAYRLVDLVTAHLLVIARGTDTKIDDIVIPLARRAFKIVVVAFGVMFVAQNLDIDITSLLAGLGIGGIALALAAKDTVENLFGSVTVLVDRPFQIGDWVVIDDIEGTVEEIGFRSTRVRTFYNSKITVPNARLVNAAVDNLGARRYRRVKCMISVQYDTPPERLEAFCEGIRELIRRHPYTRKDYYMVYFNAFAASSLDILLYAFHETPDWPTELRERHRLFVDIVRLAQRLGVEFAFPTQTLHIASTPEASASAVETEQRLAAHADSIALGRKEADEIMSAMWGEGAQPPVDFGNAERIPPGRSG
jgi:MscS family membrane protein